MIVISCIKLQVMVAFDENKLGKKYIYLKVVEIKVQVLCYCLRGLLRKSTAN